MSKKTKKVYIIAEIGVNHNGQLSVAKKLIKSAKKCGADAVKFQTFRAESLVVPTAKKTTYQLKFDSNDSQLDMLKKYELSKSDHKVLLNYANNLKIDFISTPFDFESYKFLVSDLKLKTIKVSSTDITNIPYLLDLGSTNSKIIISTGMSTLRDVIIALSALAFGNKYKGKKLKYDFNSIKDKYFYKKNYKTNVLSRSVVNTATALAKKMGKRHKSSKTHTNPPDKAVLLTENLSVLNRLSQVMDMPLQAASKTIFQNKDHHNKLFIFDANYMSYAQIFSVMKQLKQQGNQFRILPKESRFILGSDRSDDRGTVTVF